MLCVQAPIRTTNVSLTQLSELEEGGGNELVKSRHSKTVFEPGNSRFRVVRFLHCATALQTIILAREKPRYLFERVDY